MTSVLLDLSTKLTIDRMDGMLYIEMTNGECDAHQVTVSRRTGVLWCTVVYCGVLWCTVVYCGVLWCTVVYCGVLWCTVMDITLGTVTR